MDLGSQDQAGCGLQVEGHEAASLAGALAAANAGWQPCMALPFWVEDRIRKGDES